MQKVLAEALLAKKEYYQYKADPNVNYREGTIDEEGGVLKAHSHQLFGRNYMSPATDNKRLLLMHGTGCHAEGTQIMMFDGTIRGVETIKVGELLMGDDGTPRTVLELKRGRQLMYSVVPDYGEPFVCNADHILSVKNPSTNNTIDISIKLLIARDGFRPNSHLYKYSPLSIAGFTLEQRIKCFANHPIYYDDDKGAYIKLTRPEVYCAGSCGFYTECDGSQYRGYRVTSSGFTLKPLQIDNFYGFALTGNHRYLLGDSIVTHNTGKTLSAALIAQSFVKIYRQMYADLAVKIGNKNYEELDINTPTVFVLGFGSTRAAFTKELLSYSEFGFVTHLERDDLLRRQRAESVDLYWDYYKYLRRRIFNKAKGGFYKFYGYQEFVNRLFIGDTKLVDIVGDEDDESNAVTLEHNITEYIKSGKIQVNTSMLKQLNNSLVICDEVHDTFNSRMKNNYGIAIQYILDAVPTLRAVFLSATPINNSPTEIVEILNYLGSPLTKQDIFNESGSLKPNGLQTIADAARGRVSFLQDSNVRYFPKRVFKGTQFTLPRAVTAKNGQSYSVIPYLSFIQCPMSKLHQATCEMLASEHTDYPPYSYHRMPSDGYTLFNMVYPNPETDNTGLFTSGQAKTKIELAPREWQDKHKIYVKRSGASYVFTGEWLLPENVAAYSTKMKTTLDILATLMPADSGKLLIYHHRVRMDGVLQIAELLRYNGFVDESTEPTDNTICAICGVKRVEHNAQHTYKAARFTTAHSDIEKGIMEANLARFNDPGNLHGYDIKILIGSRIIRQGYDFKACQHNIIVSKPLNIPTLLQIFGRSIRKRSHVDLPPDRRSVNIYILLTTINPEFPHSDDITHEQYHYIDKLGDYQTIQQIEATLSTVAIDGDIHRDIVMPAALKAQYFKEGQSEPVKMLGALYFEPELQIKELSPNLTTYNARGHAAEEIDRTVYILKRLFYKRQVWSYSDLWVATRRPPVGLETNPALILEENFALALSKLCAQPRNIIDDSPESTMLQIYDSENIFLFFNEQRYKVEQIGDYYAVFPVQHTTNGYKVDVDVELYTRLAKQPADITVNLSNYVQSARALLNFGVKRDRYMLEDTAEIFNYSVDFQQAMLEEIIMSNKRNVRYKDIIALYAKYDAIILSGEVKRYKDIAKQFEKFPPDEYPIGYVTRDSVKLWNGSTWFKVSKVAINRYVQYRDNDKLVGYFEHVGDSMKFKVRKPSHMLVDSRADKKDTRLIEKGTVCTTKNKVELMGMLAILGISHKKLREGLKIKNICDVLLERLLYLESLERAGGTRVKWFYNWFDEQPDIITVKK